MFATTATIYHRGKHHASKMPQESPGGTSSNVSRGGASPPTSRPSPRSSPRSASKSRKELFSFHKVPTTTHQQQHGTNNNTRSYTGWGEKLVFNDGAGENSSTAELFHNVQKNATRNPPEDLKQGSRQADQLCARCLGVSFGALQTCFSWPLI